MYDGTISDGSKQVVDFTIRVLCNSYGFHNVIIGCSAKKKYQVKPITKKLETTWQYGITSNLDFKDYFVFIKIQKIEVEIEKKLKIKNLCLMFNQ